MRRPLAVLVAAVALVSGTALTAAAAPPSGGSHAGRTAGPTSSGDWLGEINLYRAAAGLAPVSNNADWDQGITNHLAYLAHTDPALMTGQYASAHTENPASPYYTDSGAQEGAASNLFMGAVGYTPVQFVDGWLAAPFHAIGILRPDLTQVAFAYDPVTGDAGLDVISGLDQSEPLPTAPTLFPGNGMTTYLDGYGGELPDPVESCSWPSTVQPGLPLIALLPSAPTQGLTATLTGPDGTMSTANGQLCAVDADTYHSSDPVYGPTGLQILQGDNAVLLIPQTPLTWGRYTADIQQAGQPDVSWSFIAAVPGQVQGGHAYELHVDSTGASTVLGNLTVTNPGGVGFTTAYPCGGTPPLASTSNYTAGATVANFAAVHPDANGDICLFTRADSDLVWDQVAATDAVTAGTPQRLLDTRATGDRPAAGGTVTVHVTDSGASTVFGNLTVVDPSGTGYATAYPCGGTPPLASNINYVAGQTVADFAAVHPDSQGDICLYTLQGADLIWDQVAQTSTVAAGSPQRLLDTRLTGNRPAAGHSVTVHVTDSGASTVFGTLTAVNPSGVGFTTAYPCDQPLPLASNSNYLAGQTVATFAAVHPDTSGDICLYTYASADLLWDQVAQTSTVTAGTPVRLLDTRTETSHLN